MKRFFLLFLAAMAAIRALHATPISTANCLLGATTRNETAVGSASCFIDLPSGDQGVAFQTSVEEYILPNGLFIFASLGGIVNNNHLGGLDGGSSGLGTDDLSFITPGPRRLGIIQFMHNGVEGGALALIDGINVSGGVTGSSAFELGVPFEFSFRAGWSCIDQLCGGMNSEVSFALFEADGTTPAPLSINAVPEPASWGLVLFGLGLYGWVSSLLRRLRTRPSL